MFKFRNFKDSFAFPEDMQVVVIALSKLLVVELIPFENGAINFTKLSANANKIANKLDLPATCPASIANIAHFMQNIIDHLTTTGQFSYDVIKEACDKEALNYPPFDYPSFANIN
ncbi:MAG: hypothetical protein RR413_11550 [Christensenellaceae bacterium]